MKIGIAGAGGRMGRILAERVRLAGHTLVGGTTRGGPCPDGVALFPTVAALARACDAVIDFTHPDTTIAHAEALGDSGTAWILGTTGQAPEHDAAIRRAAARTVVVRAANFSPGVNLVLALAERLGAALPAETYDAEILEMHHRHKRDAPSGTALAIAAAVAAGRGEGPGDARSSDARETDRNRARTVGAVGFASLRGGEIVGEHTLIFAADTEQITLGHRALDRASFAMGAIRAALWAEGKKPALYGMKDVLAL